MSRKRWLLILVAAFLVGVVLYLGLGNHHKTKVVGNTEAERGGQQEVAFANTGPLNNYLLSSQFEDLIQVLSNYVLTYINPAISSATVSDTSLASDGSISFNVTTTQHKQSFSAKVIRLGDGQFTLQVLGANFTDTVDPYNFNPPSK